MPAYFVRDDWAVILHRDGRAELYLASVDVIDTLRTRDLQAVGLAAETMRALWAQAAAVQRRALDWPPVVSAPLLFDVNALTGAISGRWEAVGLWPHVRARLSEVAHAA
jgi:hypothetical protein